MGACRWVEKVCFVLMLTLLGANLSAQIYWESDGGQAVMKATQQNKPIFMYLTNGVGEDCKRFERKTLVDNRVSQLLSQKFICLKYDISQATNVAKRFEIMKVPAVILMDSNGKEFSRILTYTSPGQLLTTLGKTDQYIKESKGLGGVIEQRPLDPNTIFLETFDDYRGWVAVGTSDSCTGNIGLVRGAKGRAIRVDYTLEGGSNWVALYRDLKTEEQFTLPSSYRMIFFMAGVRGGAKLDLKLVDADGSNFGTTMDVPRDFQPRHLVLDPSKIRYMWGGDSKLDKVVRIEFAIKPNERSWNGRDSFPDGQIFFDELEFRKF